MTGHRFRLLRLKSGDQSPHSKSCRLPYTHSQPDLRKKLFLFLPRKELAHDLFHIALVAINRVIQSSHLGVRELASQSVDRVADLRVTLKRLSAKDWRGFIRRKVMSIIFELHESQPINQAVRLIAGDQIHLTVRQRLISQ